MAITPLSQLFNTFLFACFALATYRFSAIVFQGAFVLCSLFVFRGCLRGMRARAVFPVIPVLAFVFAVNCFRGSGEVIARFGIFVLVRQGVLRGTYYASVIILLFVMSRLLTKGFSQGELFDSLYTLSRLLKRSGGASAPRDPMNSEATFLAVLFSVLGMFQVAYAEMRIFFRKGERSLKRKCVAYFRSVYEKSLSEFQGTDAGSWRLVRPLPLDYVYSASQIALLAAAAVLPGRLPWLQGP
jgi:energy-coupling factor transporter transmembrane protein EcfT